MEEVLFNKLRPYIAIVEAQIRVILRELPELLSIVLMIYIFTGLIYFGGRLIGSNYLLFYEITGYEDPFKYQLIGVSIIAITMIILSSMSQYINTEMLSGRIDSLAMAPISINIAMIFASLPILSSMLLIFGVSTLPIVIYALSNYGIVSIVLSLLVLIIGIIPIMLLGIIISLFILIFKIPQIVNLVQAFIFILSGALYPVFILPSVLQLIASGVPITYVIDISRSLLLKGLTATGINGLIYIFILSLIYISIGYILVKRLSLIAKGSGA